MADVIDFSERKARKQDAREVALAASLSKELAAVLNKRVGSDLSMEMIVLVVYKLMKEGILMCKDKSVIFDHILDKLRQDRMEG